VPRAARDDKNRTMTRVARALDAVLGFALPPRCPACGEIVIEDANLCAACWSGLEFLTRAGCTRCGAPGPDGLTCAACLAAPPAHDGVLAAVAYGDVPRNVVLKFKYGRRPGIARLIARDMRRNVDGMALDLLVPVPLHRWRLWSRGFNQSALIATRLAAATGVPADLQLLRRTKATPPLRGLGARDRANAVRGAFAVDPRRPIDAKGRAIGLVDDVYTSGATADACTRALKRAGATRVVILSWARVVRDEQWDR
jgi:ComF family protein